MRVRPWKPIKQAIEQRLNEKRSELGEEEDKKVEPIISPSAKVADSARLSPGVLIAGNCVVDGEVYIGEGSKLYENVRIGARSSVGSKVEIHANTKIGSSSIISDNCLIGNDVVIGDNVSLSNNVYIGFRAFISDGCKIGPRTRVPSFAVIPPEIELEEDSSFILLQSSLYPVFVSDKDIVVGCSKLKCEDWEELEGASLDSDTSAQEPGPVIVNVYLARSRKL